LALHALPTTLSVGTSETQYHEAPQSRSPTTGWNAMPGTDKSDRSISAVTDQEALDFHARGRPGKLEISPTKAMATQRDLSLAYSPGVAVPVKAIAEDPSPMPSITPPGQSGGGDFQRHRHSRPRQSRRAGFQAGDGRQGGAVQALCRCRRIDIESPPRTSTFINCVALIGADLRRHQSGGHQGARMLHHRAAPARDRMDIPVFHDDQHGTAIIAAAG
jgi:malate dehydrogenase (oxaloacetate-decarboxylating)(NADP+)